MFVRRNELFLLSTTFAGYDDFTLRAKADSLAEQIGPEYMQVMDGVEEVDPLSAEGEQFEAVFNSLDKQCK